MRIGPLSSSSASIGCFVLAIVSVLVGIVLIKNSLYAIAFGIIGIVLIAVGIELDLADIRTRKPETDNRSGAKKDKTIGMRTETSKDPDAVQKKKG